MSDTFPTPTLGALADLPGAWQGSGLIVATRPDPAKAHPFLVTIRQVDEKLDIERIPDTPNRSNRNLVASGPSDPVSRDTDILFGGLRYRRLIESREPGLPARRTDEESGLLLNIPQAVETLPEGETCEGYTVCSYLVRHALMPNGYNLTQWGRESRYQRKPDIPDLAWSVQGRSIADADLAAYRTELAATFGKEIDGFEALLRNPHRLLQQRVDKPGGIAVPATVALNLSADSSADGDPTVARDSRQIATLPNQAITVVKATTAYWLETAQQGTADTLLYYSHQTWFRIGGVDYPQITVGVLSKPASRVTRRLH
ncbi:hypothetical protein [Chitinimonas koreensis]|uniref:hypothetical protein n=1 Tax=Chitinimonas koreensis TaxID=356302 RepID=UPI000405A19F|nr:hypothetical protein [Chitinimonas koreensis]QNM96518.1 hypothetical protein H9L41_22575 [Chitinimonas koreensis]